MKDNIFVLTVILLFVFVGILGLYIEKAYELKKQAVELNHAEYNVKTGEWQWITNR